MKHLLTTAAAGVLLMGVTACGSSDPADDAPETYDASRASAEEKWAQFEELAAEAGVDPRYYPATPDEAERAAKALCSRTPEDVAAIDGLMTQAVGEEQYAAEMEAEIFFLEAYCPEQVAVFEKGHEMPRPEPKG